MDASAKKKTSRRTIALSVVAAVLILVIVFAYVAPRLTPPPVKPKEKVLVVGTSDYIWGIDPYDMRGYVGHMMSSMIYDTLTRLELNKDGVWDIKPCLALNWAATDGKGAVWDFELRSGVFFHDGTPFNASAVKFSFDRTIAGKKGEYFTIGDYIKSVEVLGTYKVRVNLFTAFSGFASVVSTSLGAVVSPTAVARYGEQYSTKSLIGTGPFKFQTWIPDDQVVVVKNDNYWDKEKIPKIDKFTLRLFKDPSTLKLALEKGELDIAHRNLLPSDVPALMNNPGLNVFKGPQTGLRLFQMNPRPTAPAGKYLSNTLVRQAIAYAIDYDRIAKFRDGERAYGLWHKGQTVPDIGIDVQKGFQYDPAKAKQLLAQAGYPNGIPQAMDLLSSTANGPEEADMAAIVKSNLAAIGITVNIVIVDSPRLVSVMNTGNSTLALTSANAIFPDPDDNGGVWYYSKGVNAAKRFGLNRTDFDQLVLQARVELDANKKQDIYRQLQTMCDGPDLLRGSIFLYWPYHYVVSWKYVKGNLTPIPMLRYSIDWTQVDMDPERKIS